MRTLSLLTAVVLATLLPAAAAVAAPRLTVTPASDLDPDGQTVTVRGEGYDEFKGVYVAWCVVPPAGEKPSPCGGGEDRDGSSGNSVWVSSNPPMYGLGLAEPYDGDGGFEVEIAVSRYIDTEDGPIDCFETDCAVVTRNDHERSTDRSQDVFASVSFLGQPGTGHGREVDAAPNGDDDTPTAPAAPPPSPSTAPSRTPPTTSGTPRPAASAAPSSDRGGAPAVGATAPASDPTADDAPAAPSPAPDAAAGTTASTEDATALAAPGRPSDDGAGPGVVTLASTLLAAAGAGTWWLHRGPA